MLAQLRAVLEQNAPAAVIEAARRQFAGTTKFEVISDHEVTSVQRSAKVPEDLRGPDWRYLSRKLDSADRKIRTPSGGRWTGFEPHPERGDLFFGMDDRGGIYSVDARSGAVERRGEVGGGGGFQAEAVSISVSRRGDRLAVAQVAESAASKSVSVIV